MFCTLQNLTIDYWFYRVTKTQKLARSEGAPVLRIIYAMPPLPLPRSLFPSPNASFILPSSEKLPWPRWQAFILGPKFILLHQFIWPESVNASGFLWSSTPRVNVISFLLSVWLPVEWHITMAGMRWWPCQEWSSSICQERNSSNASLLLQVVLELEHP